MQIDINGKRNITLDFNAPKKFRLVKDGAEIPYIRTGKNSFRLSKPVEGFVELEEIVEQPRYMQPVQLQPQQMTVINPQDVDRLNEAIRQMSLVNPQDVMIINQTAEQLEKNQNFIAQTQKEITDNQVYIDQQQQRLNETALGIQALETDNSQRLDGAENAILNLASDIANTQNMAVEGMNTALNKIEEQGILLQAEIDKKADKDELETLRKDFEEKSDQFSNAMSNYSGGYAYDTLPRDGEAGQILAKRTDRQGDYIWIDQTPVIVKSKTIPTASEKYKGEVYQYVGETGDYTHGYIYECQEIENNFVWVRLDVQPNTAVWGQITGTLSDQTDLQEAFDDKQDKLTQTQMDAVNSGANQSNIAQISTNQTNINTINSKIPAQASSSNQLADREFVNSSISTNTANFIGTFASISDLESYTGTVTNNDYAFVVNRVVTDNGNDWATFTSLNAYDKSLLSNFDYAWVINGSNFDLYRFDIVNQVWELRATAIEKSTVTLNSAYNRYKAVVSGSTTWTYEYTLNNSSFTAEQWQAINSGITDDLVDEFKEKGASLDYTNDVLSLEDSDGNVLSSVTIQASAAADNKSITKNSSQELQTVGVINSRDTSTAIKTWTGTKAQYDAIVTKDPNTLYNITDDVDEIVITRTLGQIVQSTIPLVDAGLHLLDGSVIAYGSYKAFVDYIAGLVSDYPDLFTSEANWQTSVANYGMCEKFVYNSVNKTVRLPKYSNDHGALIKSYSSGTDWYRIYADGWCEQGGAIAQQSSSTSVQVTFLREMANTDYVFTASGLYNQNAGTDHQEATNELSAKTTTGFTKYIWSRWYPYNWMVTGYTDISGLQQSPIYEYICIATYPKTQIEVDIDEIATDLNGKADIDLSNMNPTQTVKNTIVGWGMPDYANAIEMSLTTSELLYACPKNGIIAIDTAGFNGNYCYLKINDVTMFNKTSNGNSYMVGAVGSYLVSTGDVIKAKSGYGSGFAATDKLIFIPLKGVN
jgi:hypothetical protein